jgi:hypothetical protein
MTDASASGTTPEENKAVIRRFVEEVQNDKSEDAYDELNDPEFVNLSSPPGIPADREGGKVFLFGFLNAFPDCRFTIDDMIAEGDRVVTKKTFRGTHEGEFAGIRRRGRRSSSSSSTSSASERQDRRALELHRQLNHATAGRSARRRSRSRGDQRDADTDSPLAARERQAGYCGDARGKERRARRGSRVCPRVGPTQGLSAYQQVRLGKPTAAYFWGRCCSSP